MNDIYILENYHINSFYIIKFSCAYVILPEEVSGLSHKKNARHTGIVKKVKGDVL